MKMMKTGDNITLELISSDEAFTGTLTGIRPIETGGFQGLEKEIEIPGYGPVTVLCRGETMTDEQTNYLRSRSGMPQRFLKARWKDFKWSYYGGREVTSRSFRISQAFILKNGYFRDNNKGLYILGRTAGSGKTMLACVLANEIMEKYSCTVKYVDQESYLSFIRSDETRAREAVKAIWNCPVLFLDGFGNCGTQWQREQMLKLIETRQRPGYSTCYISSTSPERVSFDDSNKANDLINSNSIGVRIPDIQVRAMIAAEENKRFEMDLFADPQQMKLDFSGA